MKETKCRVLSKLFHFKNAAFSQKPKTQALIWSPYLHISPTNVECFHIYRTWHVSLVGRCLTSVWCLSLCLFHFKLWLVESWMCFPLNLMKTILLYCIFSHLIFFTSSLCTSEDYYPFCVCNVNWVSCFASKFSSCNGVLLCFFSWALETILFEILGSYAWCLIDTRLMLLCL